MDTQTVDNSDSKGLLDHNIAATGATCGGIKIPGDTEPSYIYKLRKYNTHLYIK